MLAARSAFVCAARAVRAPFSRAAPQRLGCVAAERSCSTVTPQDPPLHGLRVLDLSRILAGPYCSMVRPHCRCGSVSRRGNALRSLDSRTVWVLTCGGVGVGGVDWQTLGDLGAEVIKVELPGAGDDTRSWGPPFVHGEATYFLSVNKNKRSMTVNIKSEGGQNIIRQLAKESDVVLENFQPGKLAKYNLGYGAMCSTPRTTWCPRVV
mgnify:CR=1 FL=1